MLLSKESGPSSRIITPAVLSRSAAPTSTTPVERVRCKSQPKHGISVAAEDLPLRLRVEFTTRPTRDTTDGHQGRSRDIGAPSPSSRLLLHHQILPTPLPNHLEQTSKLVRPAPQAVRVYFQLDRSGVRQTVGVDVLEQLSRGDPQSSQQALKQCHEMPNSARMPKDRESRRASCVRGLLAQYARPSTSAPTDDFGPGNGPPADFAGPRPVQVFQPVVVERFASGCIAHFLHRVVQLNLSNASLVKLFYLGGALVTLDSSYNMF